MRVKIISDTWPDELERQVNDFIKNRCVIDIKFQAGEGTAPTKNAMIMWNDDRGCSNCKNYGHYSIFDEPCRSCSDLAGKYLNFKPKWEEDEDEDH